MGNKVRPGDYGYPIMAEIIPEGVSGNYKIVHQTATEKEAAFRRMLGAAKGDSTWSGFKPGTYCVLTEAEGHIVEILMSDTWLERSTGLGVVHHANGDVLIAGLGIGLVLTLIVKKPEVKSVTVIEISQDVINLVEPHIRRYLSGMHKDLRIVCADIFAWQPDKKYDTIFFDIWGDICGDNYPETKELHKKFKYVLNRANSNCWMDSWLRDEARRLHYE